MKKGCAHSGGLSPTLFYEYLECANCHALFAWHELPDGKGYWDTREQASGDDTKQAVIPSVNQASGDKEQKPMKRLSQVARKVPIVTEDFELLALLNSIKTFLVGAMLYQDINDHAAVMANEWLNQLQLWSTKRGVKLEE